ncbi:MAG: response regulator [Candidatus Eisenbacteria bacterium]|nr:response regulator [Candidatus Eisenbacteria bacterium]
MLVPKHALIAVRDERTRPLLAQAYRAAGYATTETETGRDALRSVQMERPDIVIVGLDLPDIGGRDLARILESGGESEAVRAIVVSEPGVPESEYAEHGGAVNMPVVSWNHVDELVTLVNEIFDVSADEDPASFEERLTCGEVTIDPGEMSVEVKGVPVELTKKEFRFLHVLAVNRERTCTREELRKLVWDGGDGVIGRTVDVLVSRLRSKLTAATGREIVSTVRGIGYRFTG